MEYFDISTLSCIGFISLLYFILNIGFKIYHAWTVYFFPTYPDFSTYGKWSVITGATSGIGKALAFELASRGQNVVLIARNEWKLSEAAKDIESKYGVETKCLPIDFSNEESIYDEIENFLKGMDIGVLVNNVGVTHIPVPFLEAIKPPSMLKDILRINVTSLCRMLQIVLPGMVKRKLGIIINLSSAGALRPTIYFNVYGATKALVDYLSQTLSYEYENHGITIQSCMPFWVSTQMTSYMQTNLFVRKPEDYAASLLATVTKERRTHGCWQHALQGWISQLVPITLFHASLKSETAKLRERIKDKNRCMEK